MYPKDVKKFTLWAKAMVEGATVKTPAYGKSHSHTSKAKRPSLAGNGARRKRKKRAKKAQD